MKLLVSSILGVLLLISFVSTVADRPAPCVCKGSASCNGETTCDVGQWSACNCVNGHCAGECNPEPKGKKDVLTNAELLAAAVLTEITGEEVTRERMKDEKKKFGPILEELLRSVGTSGAGSITYNGRTRSFGFSPTAVRYLNLANNQLI